MSKLVPQRRPDKNGKMVTRHVRASDVDDKQVWTPPAPARLAVDNRKTWIFQLSGKITTQMGFSISDQDEWYQIEYSLEEYSDQLLKRLNDVWKPRTQLSSAIAVMVYHGESEQFIREFAMFGGIVADETTGMSMAMSFVRSLHGYKELPQVEDYSAADAKTKAACRALLVLAERLRDGRKEFSEDEPPIIGVPHDYDSYNTPVIQDAGLVQLVVDRPDDVQRIGDIALARRTTDAETIISVMDYDTQSLASGVL